MEHVNSEAMLLATCNHPFLLRLIGAFQDQRDLYMILEIILGESRLPPEPPSWATGPSVVRSRDGPS